MTDRVIDADLWATTTAPPISPSELGARPVVFGVAVDVDATHTSISAGIVNDDGSVTTQLLKIMDGTGHAPAEIKRLCDTYAAPLVIDTRGTSADLADRLRHMGDEETVRFCDLTATDYLTVLHAADTDLDASAANSARTWAGDAWRVTRRGSTGLTSPLESCMLAAWGAAHMPEEDGPLQIY